jgi:uncharacterized protein (TIGR02117 family)
MHRTSSSIPKSRKLLAILGRWGLRLLKGLFGLSAVYVGIVLVGLIPVNRDFQPAEPGITIYVISNEVHADIVVPKANAVHDWTDEFQGTRFAEDVAELSYVAFGWGDRDFYLLTPTWEDLKLSTAAKALLVPSRTCMHVSFTRPEYYIHAARVDISPAQYRRLVTFLEQSFLRDEAGSVQQIPGYAYGHYDAFFEAVGKYHALNTCNSWAGRGLRSAGVCVPWLTPLPGAPVLCFSER